MDPEAPEVSGSSALGESRVAFQLELRLLEPTVLLAPEASSSPAFI